MFFGFWLAVICLGLVAAEAIGERRREKSESLQRAIEDVAFDGYQLTPEETLQVRARIADAHRKS